MGNRTNGSGKKGGISSRLRVGFGVKRLDDVEPARSEERGGKVYESATEEDATVY
ncbi:hypothetical protein Hanom_Chr14g01328861 [Helianthus anomalus]